MRYAATGLLLLISLIGGCVRVVPQESGKWRQDRPHPTREEILKAAAGPKAAPPAIPLTIYTTPKLQLAYMDVKVTCLLPGGIAGKYRFAVDGVFAYEGDITKRELSHIFKTSCYDVRAYCTYSEYVSPRGYQEPKTVTIDIKPMGECR